MVQIYNMDKDMESLSEKRCSSTSENTEIIKESQERTEKKLPETNTAELPSKLQANTDLEATGGLPAVSEWKPRQREWLIMISLSILSLMVALDATILVAVLPVSEF